jgi:hypothetical protein
MISFIVVNYHGDQWINLLLPTLRETMGNKREYEVIVVNAGGHTSKLDYEKYGFANLKNIRGTHRLEDFGGRLRGSLHHASGLLDGYMSVDPQSKVIVLLDHDTFFLEDHWYSLLDRLSPETPLLGVRLETYYKTPFLRPMFLAFWGEYFHDLIINNKGFDPSTEGDTAYKLTHKVDCDENANYILCDNSHNHDVSTLFSFGETAYHNGLPFFHHVGRGYFKQGRYSVIAEEIKDAKGLNTFLGR